MANAVALIPGSVSVQGQAVKIAATSTPGTLLHTTGTSLTVLDQVWVRLYNSHTADVLVTIEFGGATAPDQNIVLPVPFKSGLVVAVDGMVLTGSGSVALTVKAFAATTNVVMAYVQVYRITP